MRKSLIASLGLHAAILIAALVVLPSPKMEMKPQNAIQVDITNIGDITKVMNASKNGEKPKDKPAPKKSDSVVKAEPAEQVDKKVVKAAHEASAETPPPPKPEPKPEPPKPEPPKPKPEPPKPAPPPPDANALNNLIKDTVKDVPDPKKEPPKKPETKPVEQKPPDKPKKNVAKLNPDEIAAFLNKVDKSTAPATASQTDGKPAKAEKTMQGSDAEMMATIGDAFLQKVKECWTIPPGAVEANIAVQIHFVMNPNGTFTATPQVTNSSSDPLFEATARSAVSAMIDCQPYDFLPKDRYDQWRDSTMIFNPNMMTN